MIKGIWETREVYINDQLLSPDRSLSVANHSPSGFNWGYAGSGPSQLALALLIYFTDDEFFSRRHYQAFKREVIATLPESDFEIAERCVKDWIEFTKIIEGLDLK